MTEPVAEAYEAVEKGHMSERDFRDFTFLNPRPAPRRPQPRLLRRHRLRSRGRRRAKIPSSEREH